MWSTVSRVVRMRVEFAVIVEGGMYSGKVVPFCWTESLLQFASEILVVRKASSVSVQVAALCEVPHWRGAV